MPSLSESLERRILLNQLDVIGVSNDVHRRITTDLLGAQDAVLNELNKFDPKKHSIQRQRRLKETMAEIQANFLVMSGRHVGLISDAQRTVMENEFLSLGKQLARATGEDFNLARVPLKTINSLLEKPVLQTTKGGVFLDKWVDKIFSDLKGNDRRGLQQTLTNALVLGKDPEAAATNIRNEFGFARTRARTLARTSMLSAAGHARDELYKENKSLIASYTYLATLDTRTCPICGVHDGRTETNREDLPSPPLHANCRCFVRSNTRFHEELPRTGSEWDEKTVRHRDGTKSTKFTRGDTRELPPGANWQDFFGTLPEKRQRSILGKTRFNAWKSGAYNLEDFVKHSENELIPVGKLKARNAKARAKASDKAVKAPAAKPTPAASSGSSGGSSWKPTTSDPKPTVPLGSRGPRPTKKFRDENRARGYAEARERAARYSRESRDRFLDFAGRVNSEKLDVSAEKYNLQVDARRLAARGDHGALAAKNLDIKALSARLRQLEQEIYTGLQRHCGVGKPVSINGLDFGAGVQFGKEGEAPAHAKLVFEEAAGFLQKQVSKELVPKGIGALRVLRSVDSPPFAGRATQGSAASIHLRDTDDVLTYIHEMAHHLEYNNEDLFRRSREFRNTRRDPKTGLIVRKFSGQTIKLFKGDLNASPDRWTNQYAMRVYDEPGQSEILPIGVESLVRNPVYFAENDEDFFRFIIELLNGWI